MKATPSPQTAHQAFPERIGAGCANWRVQDFHPDSRGSEMWPVFPVVIANQVLWAVAKGCGLAPLLSTPDIGRSAGHVHGDDLARLHDHEDEDRPKVGVVSVKKVARPDVSGMIMHES
jgi:hypothetical protein